MTNEDHKSFIVVLKENANVDAFKKSLSKLDAKIETEFNIFKGFQIKLPSIHAASLGKDENVQSIEEDKEVKTC